MEEESKQKNKEGNMKDGLGRKVRHSRSAIKAALKGCTSYVESDNGNVIITYSEEQREVDISLNDQHYDSFEDIEEELDEAVRKFMELSGIEKR